MRPGKHTWPLAVAFTSPFCLALGLPTFPGPGSWEQGRLERERPEHTLELPQLCRLEVRLGTRSLCPNQQAVPLSPSRPPLPHDQGQSCQELQGRGPGSYLDLRGVAGPGLSMQGGLHL